MQHPRPWRTVFVWLVATCLGLALAQQAPSSQVPGGNVPAAVTDQISANGSALIIVGVRTAFVPEGRLADQTAVADQRAAMQAAVDTTMGRAAAAGALIRQRFDTIPFFTAQVDAAALAALAALPEVTSIELDALDRPLLAQSVPLINAPGAWAAGSNGAGWRVVVLDTGIEKTHSFLSPRVIAEACFSGAGGGQPTGGGASSVCPGGVFSSTAVGSGVNCSAAIDGCEHGTHVGGIAAGANGPGAINGVAPGANLIAMQVFTRIDGNALLCGADPTCTASFTSDQLLALERTLILAGANNVNRIASVNMSLGGGAANQTNCDAAQASRKAAIDNLLSIGIATVIASGNNGFTNGVSAPACISTAVSVGSSTKADGMSSFGNRSAGMIDLLAPGGDGTFAGAINSSVLGNAFARLQGTSMAAPHVAGAWAVLKQAVPGATVAQVLAALQATGTIINDPPPPAGSGASYRRINVNAARLLLLNSGAGVPGPPGAPVISGSGNTVVIAWTPPLTGGAPLDYTVVARLVPGGPVVATLPVGNVLSTTVPGAPSGTFHVTVVASNASGVGPESAGVTFNVPIVVPPPGPPTGLGVVVSGTQATFTWTPPTTGGPVTGYAIVAALSPGGASIATLLFDAPASSVIVTNVPPGTYYVRLAATNVGGVSPLSNEVVVSVAGPQPPGPPTLNPAVVAAGQVSLSWTAPTTGGTATSYIVVASLTPGGPLVAHQPVSGLGLTVPAPSGTYFVRVHAVNAVGTGPASNEITVVVP
jgi:Subtilase family/Fibronectin type III domain